MKKFLLLFIIPLVCVSFMGCNELIEENIDGDKMTVNASKEDILKNDKNIINNKENNNSGSYFKYCGEQNISGITVAVYEDKKSVIYVIVNPPGYDSIASIKLRNDYKPDKIDKSNTYFKYCGEQTIAYSKIAVYEDVHHGTMVYLALNSYNISTNYS